MARARIELEGEQAGWGPTRVVVAKLSRDGYLAQVLIGPPIQTLLITGRKLTPSELLAIGGPPPATPQAQRAPPTSWGGTAGQPPLPAVRYLFRVAWSAASLRTRSR